MSDAGESHQLNPRVLDDIVRDLDLQEASALERLQLWYRDFLNTAWDWLKKLTGGDDGWLDKATDWIAHWLATLGGGDPISAEHVIDGVIIVTVGLTALGVGYIGYRLWQIYRPLDSDQQTEISYLLSDPELQKPLEQLRPEQWAPALLSQVCLTLVSQNRLDLYPYSTNATIAHTAELPSGLEVAMSALAVAADRSLFAGWIPNVEDAAVLRNHRNEIIKAVADGK